MKTYLSTILLGILLLAACCPPTTTPTAISTETPLPITALSPTQTFVPQGNTILVTNAADDGDGSLRQALQNAQPYDTITFDQAVFPPGTPVAITVVTELPHIRISDLTLDASDAGVILDGSQVEGEWVAGLQIVGADGVSIRGLQISSFSGPAIPNLM